MPSQNTIGIDLGTTYSCVAVWEKARVEVLSNNESQRTTPSCVAFTANERMIGEPALHDPSLQENMKKWAFDVINKNDKPVIQVTFKNERLEFSPEEISAMVLSYMKDIAQRHIQGDVNKCVITVPAYFNNGQRLATIDAAKIAGLEVMELLNEPTAAAIAYGLSPRNYEIKQNDHRVLVFDFGGGTFDVSVLIINQGTFEVKATGGDSNLGGEDINNNMVDYLIKDIQRKKGVDISNDIRLMQRLRASCERIKRTLSSVTQTTLDLVDFFGKDDDYCTVITRETFEKMNDSIFKETMDIMKATLVDAKMDKSEMDEILLVGGSSRIPKIWQLVKDFFGKEPNHSVNPDEVVACGAAIHAAVVSGDIDEVSLGTQLVVNDVAPLSLGVECLGDIMSTIIERNTPIPIKNTKTYVTTSDYQRAIHFKVYQGERKQASQNSLIGSMMVDGLRPSRRGHSRCDVTFSLNTSGLLNVNAKNMDTQMTKEVAVKTEKLSDQKINDMIASAAKLKAVDDAFVKRNDARHALEDYAYKIRDYVEDEFTGPSSSKKMLLEASLDTRNWIADSPSASKEQFEQRKADLEKIAKPIMEYTH
ncbi:unnamed protein product [Absidia cylindrospora]